MSRQAGVWQRLSWCSGASEGGGPANTSALGLESPEQHISIFCALRYYYVCTHVWAHVCMPLLTHVPAHARGC